MADPIRHPVSEEAHFVEWPLDVPFGFGSCIQAWRMIDGRLRQVGHTIRVDRIEPEKRDEAFEEARRMALHAGPSQPRG